MIRKLALLLSLTATGLTAWAQTLDIRPFKTGDKLVSEVITLGTRGREIFNENVRQVDSEVAASQDSYTLKSAQGSTTYARKGHWAVEVENAQGKRAVPEAQRLKWMPPNDDVSKPYAVSNEFIATQNCGGGTGKANYEAVAKPAKLKVKISGSDQELDVTIVELEGKWQAGSCGTGRQYQKITYSKQLDQVLEIETRNFQPNGFLNFGRISRIVSVN